RARVALREGPLEHLLCLKGTKEHEAVLATEASPRAIHAGLLLTGAETGHPVRFVPKFEPPTGSPIAITLKWKEGEKDREIDARRVIRSEKSKTPLEKDWVFAGSELYVDPVSKKPGYAADDGDLITVANFANSILDLPFASTSNDADRTFVANSDQIPPRDTLVLMFLRPRPVAPAPPRR
ncbi:YdjY domain-containing protein, partial [Singulisphaera rosea]